MTRLKALLKWICTCIFSNVANTSITVVIIALLLCRSETEFNCCLTVKEELTQRTQLFHINGIGSADEQFTS